MWSVTYILKLKRLSCKIKDFVEFQIYELLQVIPRSFVTCLFYTYVGYTDPNYGTMGP